MALVCGFDPSTEPHMGRRAEGWKERRPAIGTAGRREVKGDDVSGGGRHLAARVVWWCAAAALDAEHAAHARGVEQPPGYIDPNRSHTLLPSSV